jgi:hypothetical protein
LLQKNSKDLPPDKLAAAHMNRLRKMHSNIQGNVEHVQEQTARILQEQERDLLRAFRARLFDVQVRQHAHSFMVNHSRPLLLIC